MRRNPLLAIGLLLGGMWGEMWGEDLVVAPRSDPGAISGMGLYWMGGGRVVKNNDGVFQYVEIDKGQIEIFSVLSLNDFERYVAGGGFGIKLSPLSFDYALVPVSGFGATHRLGLRTTW